MSQERAHDLAEQCTELVRGGNDFPNIWTTTLKRHPLVDGMPQSKIVGGRAVLEIRLITASGCCSTAMPGDSALDSCPLNGRSHAQNKTGRPAAALCPLA
jgi:hypothetical protein